MSGYLSGILAQLAINIVIAYSVFLPAAAGLLNLGAAGFVLIGGYVAGALTLKAGMPLYLAIPLAGLAAGLIAFVVSFPILRTRGVYMVLATFAFAEIVGGAAQRPGATMIRSQSLPFPRITLCSSGLPHQGNCAGFVRLSAAGLSPPDLK